MIPAGAPIRAGPQDVRHEGPIGRGIMFGRRKRKTAAQAKITILDEEGRILYHDLLSGLAFSDELVVRMSVAFFNDPEPCEIHRSAVRSRLFAELEQALGDGEETDIGQLGDVGAWFAAYPGARRIRITF